MSIPPEYYLAVAVTVTNALLAGIGYGVRQTYLMALKFVEEHEQMRDDIDSTIEVVDMHTKIVTRNGMARGFNIPRLERRLKPR